MTAVAKNRRSRFGIRLGHRFQCFVDGDAQVLFLEHPAELVADGSGHFVGHQVEARGQAMSGP